jgi:RNA polymerase sigma-70 factor (ECF subfamily)
MEDREIVQLYWDRDEWAIEESERKYGGLCRGVALRVLESVEDSEECVSDTWLRSWNTMPPQRPNLLGAFLARITRNLALDRWRAAHAAKRYGGETALALEELGDCVSGESMEDEADRRELVRALNGFLRSLPEQDRSLFLRRYWSVETLETLAKGEGMSVSALHRRLRRLRSALAEWLKKEGIEP